MVRVSIVIPVYNSEEFVRACLDSVLAQDHEDIKVYAVNDASPDNSLEILKEYQEKDSRVVVVDRKVNGGLCAARNSGFKEMLKADDSAFVCLIDSDDRVEPDYVSTMLKLFDKDTIMTACAYKREFRNKKGFNNKDAKVITYTKEEAETEIFCENSLYAFVWNKMYRTQYLRKTTFDERLLSFEDMVFSHDYLHNCPNGLVKYTTAKLYHYNVTFGSLSGLGCSVRRFDRLHYVRDNMDRIRSEAGENKEYIDTVNAWWFLMCLQFAIYAWRLNRTEEKKEYQNDAKKYLSVYKDHRDNFKAFIRRCGTIIYLLVMCL